MKFRTSLLYHYFDILSSFPKESHATFPENKKRDPTYQVSYSVTTQTIVSYNPQLRMSFNELGSSYKMQIFAYNPKQLMSCNKAFFPYIAIRGSRFFFLTIYVKLIEIIIPYEFIVILADIRDLHMVLHLFSCFDEALYQICLHSIIGLYRRSLCRQFQRVRIRPERSMSFRFPPLPYRVFLVAVARRLLGLWTLSRPEYFIFKVQVLAFPLFSRRFFNVNQTCFFRFVFYFNT